MAIDVVERVAFYPIKGCHEATVNGEVPQSLTVGPTGFEMYGVRDRDWVLYDPNDRVFVSQRGWNLNERTTNPGDSKLATVAVDVRHDHVAVTSDAGRLELPASPADGDQRLIQIFGKDLPVIGQSKADGGKSEGDDYFSRLLGRDVLLLRSDHDNPRMLPEYFQRLGAFNQVAGADGMPFLLTSRTSLIAAHKNSGMPQGTVPLGRYRGNVMVNGRGLGAFGEDRLNTFSIGEVGMWAVKGCSRCPVPNIDQETGENVGQALRVLRGRSGSVPLGNGETQKGVFFGQNLVHRNLGIISVGDWVSALSLMDEPNIDFRNLS